MQKISRDIKGREAKKKLMMEEERKESDVGVDYKFVFGFIGVGVVVIAGLYLAHFRKNADPRESHPPPPSKDREITLESFD